MISSNLGASDVQASLQISIDLAQLTVNTSQPDADDNETPL